VKKESLGTQAINGVNAEARALLTPFRPDGFGNDKPIQIVLERCIRGPAIMVKTRVAIRALGQPPLGDQRPAHEPARAFTVPSDYTCRRRPAVAIIGTDFTELRLRGARRCASASAPSA